MAVCVPWRHDRRVAVAVSGGADSLCLVWLATRWGRPTALIVDHGLRPGSADEASATAATLDVIGVPHRTVRLSLSPGPALHERARAARYQALEALAEGEGLLDLLLGHHADDQAETVAFRTARGSGPDGRAGMARIVERRSCRLVRPLLRVPAARLRATLSRRAGLGWVDDPSNADTRFARARLRAGLDRVGDGGPDMRRPMRERHRAAALAALATIRPEGFARLPPGAIDADLLAALIRTIGGGAYPPPSAAVARLAAAPRPATLAGVRLLPAGALGDGLLLVREAAAMAPPVAARPGAFWDGRFRLSATATPPPDATLGALGGEAARVRRLSPLPDAVLRTLPALRVGETLVAVPHLRYPEFTSCACGVTYEPAVPVAGAAFAGSGEGCGTPRQHLSAEQGARLRFEAMPIEDPCG